MLKMLYQSLCRLKNFWKIVTSETLSEQGITHQIKCQAPLLLPIQKIWHRQVNLQDSINANRAMIIKYRLHVRPIQAEAMWGILTRLTNFAVPLPAIRAQIQFMTDCIQKKIMTATRAKKSKAFLKVSYYRVKLLQLHLKKLRIKLEPVCSKLEIKLI